MNPGPAQRITLKRGREKRILVVQGAKLSWDESVTLEGAEWKVTKVQQTEVLAVIGKPNASQLQGDAGRNKVEE